MKGISPVIATILLLLITVAIVGIAFSFFSRTTSSLTTATDTQVNQQTNQMVKQISLDAYNTTSVTIRNMGTSAINLGANPEVSVYINGSARGCTWTPTSINAQERAICLFNPATPPCTSTTTIRVTTTANTLIQVC